MFMSYLKCFSIPSQTCSNISTPTKMSADLLSSTRSSPSRSQSISTMHNANDEKSFSSISSIYGKNSGLEVKTCAALQEMVNVRIPSHSDQWWCIVVSPDSWSLQLFPLLSNCCLYFEWILQEFSCQEVRESSDDMVIFFATNSDMRRFLSILETMWHSKNVSFNRTSRFAFRCNGIKKILLFRSISTRIHHSRYPFCRKMISLRPTAVSCSTVWINHGNHFCLLH